MREVVDIFSDEIPPTPSNPDETQEPPQIIAQVVMWQLVPPPESRPTLSIARDFALGIDLPVIFSFEGFDYGVYATGQITDIQGDGQQLITNIPDSYLDTIGVPNGSYVIVSVNGILRAAMVMDELMFAESFQIGGVTSNYIVLRQTGILKILYTLGDGSHRARHF